MNEYIRGVVEGNTLVCKCVRQAVERHLADLERQGDDDFPYEWHQDKADQAIEAFPLMFRHTVGSLHAGKPFHLAPWQKFVIGSIWGWRQASDGTRRFRRAYVTLGRKNGKSTLAAGIAILLANFDNEPAAQVFIGATKVDQAKLIFEEAKRMIGASPVLRPLADRRVLQINFDATNSFIRPLGSDRAFDGLNPSGILLDETHAWREQHRPFYDTITTGSASRSQPLRFTITTAGDSNSIIWKEEQSLAEKLVAGEYKEESYFAFIAQVDKDDDPFDEEVWVKSMPNLGISVDIDYIRQQAREAEVSIAAKNRFKRYFANMEVSATEQAIAVEAWDACAGEFSDWRTADVVAGAVDAGGRNDLAAVALVARFPSGVDSDGEKTYRYEVRTKCWMDTDTGRDLHESPWAEWIHSKRLSVVPYVHSAMFDYIMAEFPKYKARQVGFDPWSTQQLAEQLMQEGFQSIKVQQSRFVMHEPLKLFLELIDKKAILHDGDSLLRWAAGNLVINGDHADRWMPDRKESADKIDPIVATIMALRLASLAPEGPSGPLFIS